MGGEDIKGKQRGAADTTVSDGRRREEISRRKIEKEEYGGWREEVGTDER